MARVVYIDMSAKLEQWSVDSVIAMTDGGETVLIVPARVKRQARDWLKAADKKERAEAIYIYRFLAILVYMIAGPELEGIESIVIDRDYPGIEPATKIKNELVPLLRQRRPDFTGRPV